MNGTLKRLFRSALLLATMASGACQHDHPCDQGQIYANESFCIVPPPSKPDAAAGADMASPPPGEAGAANKFENFGGPCMQASDCKSPTDWCVFDPQKMPYCSRKDCDKDMSICPSGWTCTDLGQFVPGFPFACTQ